MKPKTFVLIPALIYIGIAASTLAWSNDMYMSKFDAYSNPQCQNYTIPEHTGESPIYAEPKIVIDNPWNTRREITYKFTMCVMETGKCAIPFSKSISMNPRSKYQHAYRLNMMVDFKNPGDYHYTVTTDITGDVTEHAEKTCGIHVKRA